MTTNQPQNKRGIPNAPGSSTTGKAGSTAQDNPRRQDAASGGQRDQGNRDRDQQGNVKNAGRQPSEDSQDDADDKDDSAETGASKGSRNPQEEAMGTGGKPGRTGDPGTKK